MLVCGAHFSPGRADFATLRLSDSIERDRRLEIAAGGGDHRIADGCLHRVLQFAIRPALADLGTGMLTATMFAAVMAVIWLTEKSSVGSFGLLSVFSASRPLVQVSIRSRHFRSDAFLGPLTAGRRHHHARDGGALTSLSLCGRPQPPRRTRLFRLVYSIGSIAFSKPPPPPATHLGTPFRAQCWYEWQRNGWAMPCPPLVLIVVGRNYVVVCQSRRRGLFIDC